MKVPSSVHSPSLIPSFDTKVSTNAALGEPSPLTQARPHLAPLAQLNTSPPPMMNYGGALPSLFLESQVDKAQAILQRVQNSPLPQNAEELVHLYETLGEAITSAEAVLLESLDALDPKTGGRSAHPTTPYERLRACCFDLLQQAGVQFDRIGSVFGPIVHGPQSWPSQPVNVSSKNGRTERRYLNSYKMTEVLQLSEQQAQHAKRVDAFVERGGQFADFVTVTPDTWTTLPHRTRYDYVMDADHSLRLYPSPQGNSPKPGHSLLATGGPTFDNRPIVMAGECWVYRDAAGDVEGAVFANNSGHFKPAFSDLQNLTSHLKGLGLDPDTIVYFGGPNNLPSLFEEIGVKCSLGDLTHRLPQGPQKKRDAWRVQTQIRTPLTIRLTESKA
jgi:hypothetical protein